MKLNVVTFIEGDNEWTMTYNEHCISYEDEKFYHIGGNKLVFRKFKKSDADKIIIHKGGIRLYIECYSLSKSVDELKLYMLQWYNNNLDKIYSNG